MSAASGPRTLSDFLPESPLHDASESLERFLAWVATTGLVPYPAQEEALLELALDHHVVLSTPTGSGKTLVALGLQFRALCEGRRSFYTAPIKALVNEKFFALCEEFGAENVGMLTGDASINWSAPVLCCTAEVLSNMALQQGDAIDAPFIVMDEFHYYGDRDRGIAWQIPLLVARRSQFLLMSATLGDTVRIENHLRERTGCPVTRVHSDLRPVPLDFAYRETPVLETIESLLEEQRAPVYVVHFTQRDAALQAQALTSAHIASRDLRRKIAERIKGFRFDTPYGPSIRRILGHGIGLHHAGLLPKYRLLVEQLAQEGLLRVVCGTDTLGVGVNIPIRTVLFSRLSKFDGEKVRILSVRDFKQISGRAGRKGFDERGSVVCQTPEHMTKAKKSGPRKRAAGGRQRAAKKRLPPRGFVGWNAKTFKDLIRKPPETLSSSFKIDHGTLIRCLQAETAGHSAGEGYRWLAELITECHEAPRRKKRLLREAAVLFRALRQAGVVELTKQADGSSPGVRIHTDLQREFSLHQVLSLYLVEASSVLDPDAPDHTLDLLSLVEAILEDPRAILQQKLRVAKRELLAELKSRGVPFEERIKKLDAFTLPKPNTDFIDSTFRIFSDNHPWIGSKSIHPKSIARDMFETYASFHDTVRRFELARMEGLLLRYLGQVHNTLVQTVPTGFRTEGILELIAYLRTMITRVDSSLVEAWESRVQPRRPDSAPTESPTKATPPVLDERAIHARARAELHQLVRALAAGDYEEAALCVYPEPNDPWNAERFEAELRPFFDEYERIRFDPGARQAHRTAFRSRGPLQWEVRQVLVDERDDNFWNIEGLIEFKTQPESGVPLVRIQRIST